MTATNWLPLADAVARMDAAGDPTATETLRRLCYDGRVRSRGMVGRAIVELGPEWWSEAVEIDTASGRIVKGPLSRRLPTRVQSDPGDRLGPGDWDDMRIPGNLAETVEVWRAELDVALTGASPEDAAPESGADPGEETEPSPKLPPGKAAETGDRPAAGGYSPARLENWYADWVAANEESGHAPSRVEDREAAREALGDAVPRDAVRALRRKLAPAGWRKQGRRSGR